MRAENAVNPQNVRAWRACTEPGLGSDQALGPCDGREVRINHLPKQVHRSCPEGNPVNGLSLPVPRVPGSYHSKELSL